MSKLLLFSIFIVGSVNLYAVDIIDAVSDYSSDSALNHSYQDLGNGNFTLEILTDLYPEESSWSLVDVTTQDTIASSGGNLESWGDYTVISQDLCLDVTRCYEFIMRDIYGDGLISQGQESGYYKIKDQNGKILIGTMITDFGYEESNYFCPADDCHLNYDLNVDQPTTSSEADGGIRIDLTGGNGPEFRYSLNSGVAAIDPHFDNLPPGEYLLEVFDRHGCVKSELITLFSTSTEDTEFDKVALTFSPNPTSGILEIEVKGVPGQPNNLPITLYNSSGQSMHTGTLNRHEKIHSGFISMNTFVAGSYYLSVHTTSGDITKTVIKQ